MNAMDRWSGAIMPVGPSYCVPVQGCQNSTLPAAALTSVEDGVAARAAAVDDVLATEAGAVVFGGWVAVVATGEAVLAPRRPASRPMRRRRALLPWWTRGSRLDVPISRQELADGIGSHLGMAHGKHLNPAARLCWLPH